MKRYPLLFLLNILAVVVFAQPPQDKIALSVGDVKLDMLKSPTNPAFLLMNTSPTEIVKPGSAPEFYTSVQNASDNFSVIPNNVGISVTPFWWGENAKKLSFTEDFDTINSFTFCRTLSLSVGIVKGITNEENLWRYGLGFQSTLLRGKVDVTKKKAYFSKLREYHKDYHGAIDDFYKKNPEYNNLVSEMNNTLSEVEKIDSLLQKEVIDSDSATKQKKELVMYLGIINKKLDSLRGVLGKKFNNTKSAKKLESNKELDKNFNEMNERIGLKWDIGGGVSLNSNNNKIDSTGLYRAGFWSNLGGNIITSKSGPTNLSAIMLARYLYYNEINYVKNGSVDLIKDLNVLDLGIKLQFEIINKFTLGFETIYRFGMSNSIYDNAHKINGLVQYHLGNNRLLYASFGNNFNDNSSSGPEDFVVTFGFNIGFGGNVDIYDVNF